MQRDNSPERTTWTPPMWLIRVAVILLVAWYVSQQIPPEKQRGAAPTPEQNATFEPSIPATEEPTAIVARDPVDEPDDAENRAVVEATKPAVDPATPQEKPAPKPNVVTKTPTTKVSPNKPNVRDADPLIIQNMTIKDQSGRVVYMGEINLHPTFERIERGEKFPHRNDGSTFRNLEGRLPKKAAGYYTEYVHPTKGLNGPGPQRVVLGKEGEAFYTHDHYDTFRKVRE